MVPVSVWTGTTGSAGGGVAVGAEAGAAGGGGWAAGVGGGGGACVCGCVAGVSGARDDWACAREASRRSNSSRPGDPDQSNPFPCAKMLRACYYLSHGQRWESVFSIREARSDEHREFSSDERHRNEEN